MRLDVASRGARAPARRRQRAHHRQRQDAELDRPGRRGARRVRHGPHLRDQHRRRDARHGLPDGPRSPRAARAPPSSRRGTHGRSVRRSLAEPHRRRHQRAHDRPHARRARDVRRARPERPREEIVRRLRRRRLAVLRARPVGRRGAAEGDPRFPLDADDAVDVRRLARDRALPVRGALVRRRQRHRSSDLPRRSADEVRRHVERSRDRQARRPRARHAAVRAAGSDARLARRFPERHDAHAGLQAGRRRAREAAHDPGAPAARERARRAHGGLARRAALDRSRLRRSRDARVEQLGRRAEPHRRRAPDRVERSAPLAHRAERLLDGPPLGARAARPRRFARSRGRGSRLPRHSGRHPRREPARRVGRDDGGFRRDRRLQGDALGGRRERHLQRPAGRDSEGARDHQRRPREPGRIRRARRAAPRADHPDDREPRGRRRPIRRRARSRTGGPASIPRRR